jgi:hypothetical protein
MEHNQNTFAPAEVEPASASLNLPDIAAGDPPARLAFDPVVLQHRRNGWTPDRQREFIEALADCGVVREAAARVGMTEQSAHWLRRRADAASFSLAWDGALRIGGDRLRSIAYDRAVNGTVKRTYYQGKVVGEDRVYNDRLLIYLLGKAEPLADRLQVANVVKDWESWMQAIEDGLDQPMPRLGDSRAPAWQAEDDSWWTSFPPPLGFNGRQFDADGEDDYRRECTLDEIAAIEAADARRKAELDRRRDLYFDPGKMKFPTPR